MTLNLDVLAGVALLITAFCLASIFTLSSKKATNWPTIPEYVRYSIGALALSCVWRGANLMELSQKSEIVLGRVNAEAAVWSIVMANLAISVSWYFSRNYLRYRTWDSVSHVLGMIRREPKLRPVAVDPIELAHAEGIYATAPGERGDAAVREAHRIPLH